MRDGTMEFMQLVFDETFVGIGAEVVHGRPVRREVACRKRGRGSRHARLRTLSPLLNMECFLTWTVKTSASLPKPCFDVKLESSASLGHTRWHFQ